MNIVTALRLKWFDPSLRLPQLYRKQAYKFSVANQIMAASVLNILSLAMPIMMLQVYDRIIPHKAYSTLVMLIVGVAVALILDCTLRIIRAWLTGWTAATHEHAAGCAAIDRFADIDIKAFESKSTGAYLQQWAALARLRDFYSSQALTAMIDLPFAALFLGMIAYLGGWLVMAPLGLLAAFLAFAGVAGRQLKRALKRRIDADDKKASYLVSVLGGIHTAKSMGMETSLVRRFEQTQGGVTKGSYFVALASGFAGTLSAAFGQLSLILTATIGSILVLRGNLSIGGLSACTLLAGRALQPVQRVLGTWLRLQDISLARADAGQLLHAPVQDRSDERLPPADGTLEVRNMSYSHNNDELLRNINLDIAQGDVIAIKGEKGSGKSTLLHLFAGLLNPNEGNVRVSGIDPAQYGLANLALHVGYLPQQGMIFKGTILDNLTGFAKDEVSVARAKEAARLLGLNKVIDLLQNGYETQLEGTASDPLPPGVKQRIALARVLKNEPAILLFDDADRALDKEGYNLLFKLMGSLKGSCTIVIVSHDQNLQSFADRTYQLEHGRLTLLPSSLQNLSMLVSAGKERRA